MKAAAALVLLLAIPACSQREEAEIVADVAVRTEPPPAAMELVSPRWKIKKGDAFSFTLKSFVQTQICGPGAG